MDHKWADRAFLRYIGWRSFDKSGVVVRWPSEGGGENIYDEGGELTFSVGARARDEQIDQQRDHYRQVE